MTRPLGDVAKCSRLFFIVLLVALAMDTTVCNADEMNSRDKSFIDAVRQGELGGVEAAIQAGVDVNKSGAGGETALHLASKLGHLEILTALIRAGARVDERNAEDVRPLHDAANAAIAERLIEAGASAQEPKDKRRPITPMYLAIFRGRADVVRVLIKNGADLNPQGDFPPILWATFFGRLEVAEVLLDAGAKANAKRFLADAESALHVAARGAFADVNCSKSVTPTIRLKLAKLLIDRGADVNATADIGLFDASTPLHGAAVRGNVEMIKLLLDNGAKVNASCPAGYFAGYTALHEAVEGKHHRAVSLLLERQADVNALTGPRNDRSPCTPVDLAKSSSVRDLLIKRGGKSARELMGSTNTSDHQ